MKTLYGIAFILIGLVGIYYLVSIRKLQTRVQIQQQTIDSVPVKIRQEIKRQFKTIDIKNGAGIIEMNDRIYVIEVIRIK